MGVWKMRGVENTECGNAECGECVENFNFQFQFQFSISNAEKQCVNNKKKEKKNAMSHCILRCAGLRW